MSETEKPFPVRYRENPEDPDTGFVEISERIDTLPRVLLEVGSKAEGEALLSFLSRFPLYLEFD